ncbi:ATP-dependent Clp protease proteolytic subunit-related protein 2, chloroplastic, partial [Cucurbita argyrosperma subsp. sororia]
MADSSAQCLQPQINVSQPSLSVATKVFSGLKLQSASPFGGAKPNITTEFYGKVHKSLQARVPGEGTWQWVDLWNALYRERVVFIGQNVDEEFSNQILATILYLDSIETSKKLYMYINGPGGDSLQSPVATHCVGCAYNLAAFLLAAGEKGNRSVMPLSRIALQPPSAAARGQADDIRNEANELENQGLSL